ncbi:DUF4864 domain-containing protein [Candidatus Pelagibacter sp.]|nr:DUF4864 domain-containing protein [Candidatus Pelagibacter sp.]
MKKIIKYSVLGLIYILAVFILAIFFINTAKADLVKPNNTIDPGQVIKIQLKGLMKNNDPSENYGIRQTWEFAHPNNQKITGPLDRFIIMIKGDSYKMLLNHTEHKIKELQISNTLAFYEVTILDKGKSYYKFNWQVEKYTKDGPLKDCWLTTMVSAPIPLGSSI